MGTLKSLILNIIFIFIFLSCTQNLNGVQRPVKVLTKILNSQSYKGKVINFEYSENLSTRYVFQDNVVEWVNDTIFVEDKVGTTIFHLILTDTSKVYLKNFLEKKEGSLSNEYK
jgi:hypothetical protein